MAPLPKTTQQAALLELAGTVVRCSGAWTLSHLGAVERALATVRWPTSGELQFDMSRVSALDTGGAWVLRRTLHSLEQAGLGITVAGLSDESSRLLEFVSSRGGMPGAVPGPIRPGVLEQVGRISVEQLQEEAGLVGFIGEMAASGSPLLLRPGRFRWIAMLQNLGAAGYRALPIVGLLSFLLGVVIAYQGGVQLLLYGANVVGLSMLRELAPLITAIIVAGRTGSAYTAQIGTMKVTEEIDALYTIGVTPMELLVLPKLVALLVALPLLTVFADIMGVFGGMVMASSMLGISSTTFLDRLAEAVSTRSYLIGIGKAPVFAAIIAAVGCYQGFQVRGSAESVGRRTTVSVVQSIFLVIVVDAAFSVAFSKLGI